MFDFGALPPEITSGRIYSGPGSAPMMAAASAWDALGAELSAAASAYSAVIDELTSGRWLGPASRIMVSAVTPYLSWMTTSSTVAEEAAGQARAAAAAFDSVFAMTVPPPVIAANRSMLAALLATNFFGQNTPAIATTEATYAEMWEQDAVAMYAYASWSAVATKLTQFGEPATSSKSAADQPASSVANGAANVIPQLLSSASVPQSAAQQAGLAVSVGTPSQILDNIEKQLTLFGRQFTWPDWVPGPKTPWWGVSTAEYNTIQKVIAGLPYQQAGMTSFGVAIAQQLQTGLGTTAGGSGAWYPTPAFAALGAGGWAPHAMASVPTLGAKLSAAIKIGGLSAPPSWTDGNVILTSSVTPHTGPAGVAAPQEISVHLTGTSGELDHSPGINAALRPIPAGSRGSQRAGSLGVRYGFRYSVLTRPPSAG